MIPLKCPVCGAKAVLDYMASWLQGWSATCSECWRGVYGHEKADTCLRAFNYVDEMVEDRNAKIRETYRRIQQKLRS